MSFKTLPSSWTAQSSFREARSTEFTPIMQEAGLEVADRDPNASAPHSSHTGLTSLTSKVVGSVALAVFLGVQEFEPVKRWSPTYYMVRQESGSSSDVRAPEAVAREEMLGVLNRIPAEDLEDGMTFDLGMGIISVVNRYHELALTTLAESILGGDVPPEMASHALRWLGRMRDPETESSRLRVLTRGLQAVSPIVRDGAALGLAVLGKQEAVLSLRRAVEEEPVMELRRDLEQVMRELEQYS